MMGKLINIITQKKNVNNYRFGQDVSFEKIEYQVRRTPYAHRITHGAVDDAIGKGIKIIDFNSREQIKNNAMAVKTISGMWIDIKKAMYDERSYGKSLSQFFKMNKKSDTPVLRSYDVKHYYAKYDKYAVAEKYTLINKIGGTHAISNQQEIIDRELDRSYEIILRETEEKGEGISIIEPVWDTLFSLAMLDENATYFAIRFGAGIRFMKIPEAKFKDKNYMSNIFSMLKGAVGVNGVYALPYATINGVKEEIQIDSEKVTQIRFTDIRDLLLGSLSAQTGIPREVFLGSQLGLRSSEKNEDSYFDYLQAIQENYKPYLLWIIYTLNEFFDYKWFSKTTVIDIVFNARETLSDEEKIDVVGKKVDIVVKAGYKVSKEWLGTQLDVELEEEVENVADENDEDAEEDEASQDENNSD
jgi:hypothetical protein